MRSMARWALAFLACSFASAPAFAQDPPAAADLAEERAFDAEARRYQRLAAFTERLVRERAQREFEEALERQRRFADLTRRLTEKADREVERVFDAEVALFLRKLELTRELAARHAAFSSAVPERSFVPDSVPSW